PLPRANLSWLRQPGGPRCRVRFARRDLVVDGPCRQQRHTGRGTPIACRGRKGAPPAELASTVPEGWNLPEHHKLRTDQPQRERLSKLSPTARPFWRQSPLRMLARRRG